MIWNTMDTKPAEPMMALLFYLHLMLTDQHGAEVSPIMENGRDERYGIGWWDGEGWKHSGTAHDVFENYSDYSPGWFPTHWAQITSRPVATSRPGIKDATK